jgi:hypothetical protein
MKNHSTSTDKVNKKTPKISTIEWAKKSVERYIVIDPLYYVMLRSGDEALFLRHLIFLTQLESVAKGKIVRDGVEYFNFSAKFLRGSMFHWEERLQKTLISNLKNKGIITVIKAGNPARRFVAINTDIIDAKIELARIESEKIYAGLIENKEENQWDGKRTTSNFSGPKNVPPVERKTDQNKKTNKLVFKEEKKKPLLASSQPSLNSPLFEKDKGTSSNQIETLTHKLINILRLNRKLTREPNFKKDLSKLTTFINNKFTTINELTKILEWYTSSIKDTYTPKAHSVNQFIDKFGAILTAFQNYLKQNGKLSDTNTTENYEEQTKVNGTSTIKMKFSAHSVNKSSNESNDWG